MSKNKVSVDNISKVKLNINYLNFIEKVIVEKLENVKGDKLKDLYLEIVKVKSSRNIVRVSERVKREKLRDLLVIELKKRNMEFKDFVRVSDLIVEEIKENKIKKYLSV